MTFLYSDHIYDIYKVFVDSGGDPVEFYMYSLDELNMILQAKQTQKKYELLRVQDLATLVVTGVASLFSKDVKNKTILDLYPNFFEDEVQQQKEAQKENETQLYKAKMDLFMQRMNAKRKRGEIDG